MNDEQAFLNAIADKPEDDSVRLVYADWLEERGDPKRAEFLRIGVEWLALVREDPNAAPQRYVELRARKRELRAGLDPAWLKGVGDGGLVWDLVHSNWGYNCSRNTFCVIVRETPKTVLLYELARKMVLNHDGCGQAGREVPVLLPLEELLALDWKEARRAQKEVSDYGKLLFWAKRQLFQFWDGRDKWFDSD